MASPLCPTSSAMFPSGVPIWRRPLANVCRLFRGRIRRHNNAVMPDLAAFFYTSSNAVASFSLVLLQHGDLGSPDLHRILKVFALVYGGGWFIPALVVSDLFLLRQTLSGRDFARYTLLIGLAALLLGFLMPGIVVMIGYPITAVAIVGCAFPHR